MKKHYDILIEAIDSKLLVSVCFLAKEKGMITRLCVPYDFGPSNRYKDGLDRFHFHDLDSPDGKHNLSILPGQIHSMELMTDSFNPKDYVTWTPNWIVQRDWGIYS